MKRPVNSLLESSEKMGLSPPRSFERPRLRPPLGLDVEAVEVELADVVEEVVDGVEAVPLDLGSVFQRTTNFSSA